MIKNIIQTSLKNNKPRLWIIICYGNILRSQVLEKYLRHYSKKNNIKLKVYSAGVSKWSEFKSARKLLNEVNNELKKRNVQYPLRRRTWNKHVERKIKNADIVLVADNGIKSTVLERTQNQINKEKVFTFYEMISEGEKDFEDTYDYEKKQQDPKRFKEAFDELERISQKIIVSLLNNNF